MKRELLLAASTSVAWAPAVVAQDYAEKLFDTICRRDAARAACLLQAGVPADVRHPRYGSVPLIVAASSGAVEIVSLLLEHGADVRRARPR